MLVLSVKVGEWIKVGDVKLKVASIDRGKAKLAFDADYSIKIIRKELADRIAREKEQSNA